MITSGTNVIESDAQKDPDTCAIGSRDRCPTHTAGNSNSIVIVYSNSVRSKPVPCTVTPLTLLDLSAAFDTIDHTILLRRLGDWFGVSGKALDWFKLYLTDRSQRIKLGSCLFSRSDLSFGVPQGSVLGPLLFTLNTSPLSS